MAFSYTNTSRRKFSLAGGRYEMQDCFRSLRLYMRVFPESTKLPSWILTSCAMRVCCWRGNKLEPFSKVSLNKSRRVVVVSSTWWLKCNQMSCRDVVWMDDMITMLCSCSKNSWLHKITYLYAGMLNSILQMLNITHLANQLFILIVYYGAQLTPLCYDTFITISTK